MIQGMGSASLAADLASAARTQRAQPAPSEVQEPSRESLQTEPSLEAASPFEIAQQIQEVQTQNLKRTLDAQTQILDLLA